ncbi:MAG TPA: Hsp20/alpha crystallin family protein [Bryobacteraceae bacterium]|nr:Hsp20/alpha crystallin family protein [Bryobacteraceae bacterium]
MAEAKVHNQPSQEQRGVARWEEYFPAVRDFFTLDPFAMMRRLSEEMDRAISSSFGLTRSMGQRGMWSPAIEVRELDNQLEISAELPGLNKDNVKLEVTEDQIILEGEKKIEEEKKEKGFVRSERSYGHFYRAIPLPDGADPEKAKAEFKDGILRVTVPIAETKRQAKRIPIS